MKTTVKIGRETLEVKENIIDRVIRYFDPIKGQNRFKSRITTAIAGGYSGGSRTSRTMKAWNVTAGDADSDIIPDLPMLRERSRDLVRNTPIATSAINSVVTNVIGGGLVLQSTIDRVYLNLSDEDADAWEAQAEREFDLWADSKDSDASRTINFYGHQNLAFRSTLENGDVFYLTPQIKRNNNPYSLSLLAIEADRICNKDNESDSQDMAGGIKVGKFGEPVEYYILKYHPGSVGFKNQEWTTVRAFGSKTDRRNIIHLFDVKRPGQKRGVPYLAPVIDSIKQLGRYTDAELMAAVVSGMFTVFIESESQNLDVFAGEESSTSEEYTLGNGSIVGLAPGEKVSAPNPGRPNSEFDPFVTSILRQIGAALEIPFEILIKHFTASYSASKAAFVEAWKFFRARRSWMVQNFCNPIYELWMDEAVASGRLYAPGYFSDPMAKKAYLGASWRGPGKGQIQELQEAKAATERINSGISTRAQESAEINGSDFDTNHRQLAKEMRMRKEAGLAYDPVAQAMQFQQIREDSTDETN